MNLGESESVAATSPPIAEAARGESASLARPQIAHKTARGTLYVALGQTLLRLVGFVGTVFLARWLSPQDFGIYAVTSFAVLQLGGMTELGLGAALIYDHDIPSIGGKRSVFAVLGLLSVFAYCLLYFFAPVVSRIFSLPNEGPLFLRICGLALLLFPLRVIPLAMLARELRFSRTMTAEAAAGVTFQAAAVLLALAGCSYWSFGVALLLSTAIQTALLNIFSPWPIGFCWDTAYLRRSVRFGGAFQLSSLTAVFRDNMITFLGGPLFGPRAVGLLNWAHRLSWYCSQTYVGVCAGVAFPSLSRLRDEPEAFRLMAAKMLRYVNLATFLTLSIAVALLPDIITIVFTDKWQEAAPMVYLFAIRMVGSNYTTVLDLALRALGHPERALRICFAWTVWEWIIALIGAAFFGPLGIALAMAVGIWPALIWQHVEVSRRVAIDLRAPSVSPACAAAVTVLALRLVRGWATPSISTLLLLGVAGAVVYGVVWVAMEGNSCWKELKKDFAFVFTTPGNPQACGASQTTPQDY